MTHRPAACFWKSGFYWNSAIPIHLLGPVAAFLTPWQSGVIMSATTEAHKARMLAFCPFTERSLLALVYRHL